MKITLEKNNLAELSIDIPDEYYNELYKLNSNISSTFGLTKKQTEAIYYLINILKTLNKLQEEILLEELNLTRSDVYGKSN